MKIIYNYIYEIYSFVSSSLKAETVFVFNLRKFHDSVS